MPRWWERALAHQAQDIDPGRPAVVRQLAVTQGDAPLHPLHELELMGGHHQRPTLAVGLVEELEEGGLAGGVEPDEGFVDEEKVERADEAQGERRLLA